MHNFFTMSQKAYSFTAQSNITVLTHAQLDGLIQEGRDRGMSEERVVQFGIVASGGAGSIAPIKTSCPAGPLSHVASMPDLSRLLQANAKQIQLDRN